MHVLKTTYDIFNIAVKNMHINLGFVKDNHPKIYSNFVVCWDGLSAVHQEVSRFIDMGFAESMEAISRLKNEASKLDPQAASLTDMIHTLNSGF